MLIVASSISFETSAQKKVGSGSFNSVLKVMLKHDVKEVTVTEAEIKRNVIFIDAREKKEFDVSHIRNAIYAGYKDFNLAMLNAVSKQSEVIVYCSIGKRSEDITKKLVTAGYSNVSNLYGGIFEWVNQGNNVVDNNNRITPKVHAYGKFWGRWLDKGEKVYN
ncbi:MAG: rhodanese-like domain-containing protein [Chitinophagaceae bacterium]